MAQRNGYRTALASPQMGGEDFAFYLHHVPRVFINISSASDAGLHHPAFDPDESLIEPAVNYFTQFAPRALNVVAGL